MVRKDIFPFVKTTLGSYEPALVRNFFFENVFMPWTPMVTKSLTAIWTFLKTQSQNTKGEHSCNPILFTKIAAPFIPVQS